MANAMNSIPRRPEPRFFVESRNSNFIWRAIARSRRGSDLRAGPLPNCCDGGFDRESKM